jgi:guanosine monophosphate reductase
MCLDKSFSLSKRNSENLSLRGLNQRIFNDAYGLRTHSTNRFTKDYVYGSVTSIEDGPEMVVWDIEVDDDTHSFIANNCVVHNSACTTRKQTGVGCPQLSAVMECSDAAHGLGGHVISDGGCVCPGDVAKAFGAGADFVMLGGMLAGHDESGGELVERNGRKYKLFYGMSSSTAMHKYSGGVAEYRSSEGKTVEVEYRGKLSDTIKDILGGLRSTCTYIGASKLKEVSRRTTFIRVSQQMNNVFS